MDRWWVRSLALALGAWALASSTSGEAAVPGTGEREERLVLVGGLEPDRVTGEVVCVYNFSSW